MTANRGRGPTLAKDVNRRRIYAHLKQLGRTTRADIARSLTLNKNTVNAIIDEFTIAGFAEDEGAHSTPGVGRRPIALRFRAENRWALGIQVTAAAIHFVAADLLAHPLSELTLPLETPSPGEVARVIRLGAQKLNETLDPEACIGIGIGIPGLLDQERRVVLRSSHLGWSRIPLLQDLESLHPGTIRLDNSAKFATLGELRQGDGKGHEHFVYTYFGNGIGCGIYSNGQMIRGADGMAGELGHIVIDADGPACECGNNGCLEAVAGLQEISRRVSKHTGIPPQQITVDRLLGLLESAHRPVAEEIARVGQAVGQALSAVVNLLNPELIVFDGPLMKLYDHLLPSIKDELARRCVTDIETIRMARSGLASPPACIGAAESVIQAWEESDSLLHALTSEPRL